MEQDPSTSSKLGSEEPGKETQRAEAYRLARILLAKAYASTSPSAADQDPRRRLRRAALGVTTSLLPIDDGPARADAAPQQVLVDVAAAIESCRHEGYLSPEQSDSLRELNGQLLIALSGGSEPELCC